MEERIRKTDAVGIDVGYGFVKSITSDKRIKFPSVFKRVEGEGKLLKKNFDWGEIEKYLFVEFKGTHFLVGDFASLDPESMRAFSLDRSKSAESTELFFSLGGILLGEGDNLITKVAVTGLPATQFNDKVVKDFLKILGNGSNVKKIRFVIPDELLIFQFNKLAIVPQPFGSFYYFFKNEKIKDGETVLVIDIGYKTADILKVAVKNGNILTINMKTYVKWGINNLIEEKFPNILIEKGIGSFREVSRQEIDKAFRTGKIKDDNNKLVDVTEEIKKAKNLFIDMILSELKPMTETSIWSSDKVVLTGGGMHIVGDMFKEAFGDIALMDSEPEFTNVKGYYFFGLDGLKEQ